MIDYRRLYHTGFVVPDLERAMDELGRTLGLTWAAVREMPALPLWTAARGRHEVALRFVYSCEEPQHVELLQGDADSIWDPTAHPGINHVGLWVDDVAAETERCVAAGWTVVAAAAAPEDGYGGFSYVEPPTGVRVELVDDAIRPSFEAWWAAGLGQED
ncbi:MAG: VOC family protein [Actinomycetota bacterium]